MNLSSFTEAFILAIALSIDAFLAAFAYGGQKIKVPALSVATISLISALVLLLSLKVGGIFAPNISQSAAHSISFAVLIFLGLIRIFDSYLKKFIKRRQGRQKTLEFSALDLKFILNVYADPQAADIDKSLTLSVRESAALSIALSLDSIAAGVGAGIAGTSIILSFVLFIILTVAAVKGGCLLGNKIAGKLPFDISWISGAMLIVLAFIKLAA